MFDLTGKTAIVTGGTKGLGLAIVQALSSVGAQVVVVSRNAHDCKRVAQDLEDKGRKAFGFACDITQSENIQDLIDNTLQQYGRIDILINNAGVAVTKPAVELTEEDWDFVINTNLKGVFMMAQAVGQVMIQQQYGRIINMASMFGLVGDKNVLPYLCSKGGVIQMTKGLALEWARHNITVNAIAPGYVVTPINEAVLKEEKVQKYLLGKTPLRRFGKGHEVASAAVYLSSDESSYVTGSVFSVDGGWTAQ